MVIARAVEAALLRTTRDAGGPVSGRALELHRQVPVVDLLVGTVLFRRTFLEPAGRGHVDLPRLRAGGVRLVGMSIATRFPDLQGTLSAVQFLSLGVPPRLLRSDLALVREFVRRIDEWSSTSRGAFRVVRTGADLDVVLAPGGPVGAFIGVQGAQALQGDPRNVARLQAMGVRMLSLAHVMDNAMAGSGTGRRAGGLTPPGRQALAEAERVGVLVDLAHASSRTIRDAVALATVPPVLSHTGFVERAGSRSRWRRYSAATRNVPVADARLVAEAGGVVGVTAAAQLLGGESVRDFVDALRFAIDELGPDHVAIGSDMDGALRTVIDAAGMPRVTDGLLAAGVRDDVVAAVMGANAIHALRRVLPG